jgi:hypothetical protein
MDETRRWDIERPRLIGDLMPVDRRWLAAYPNVLPPVYPPRYVVYRGKSFPVLMPCYKPTTNPQLSTSPTTGCTTNPLQIHNSKLKLHLLDLLWNFC